MKSLRLGAQSILVGLLACLFLQALAENSSELSLKSARDALIQKAAQHQVFGNSSDPISLAGLPGYTGWNRNRIDSKVDQCFVTKIGNQTVVALGGFLNIFMHDISKSSNMWTISVACPKVTATVEQGHLPTPLFYSRAYGPAILVGSQKNSDFTSHSGGNYSVTEISFFIIDPGLYTVEVVFESNLSPNIYRLPHTLGLDYEGFLLRGFPLILNVTSSDSTRCNTAISCNMNLCTSKDIESDLTSTSGRWIVLGKTSTVMDKHFISELPLKDEGFRRYVDGSNRLSIETDYKPINCVLAPLRSSIQFLDTCVRETGIHFILIGDSVSRIHAHALKQLLNPRNRVTWVSLRGELS